MRKILTWCLIFSSIVCEQKAIIVVPVADLVGQPLSSFYKNTQSVKKAYDDLAYAGIGDRHYYACPRLHQALLHETVELIETRGKEARIRIPNLFYQTHANKNPQCDYWTLKDNIITLEQLKAKGISAAHIPDPIKYSNPTGHHTSKAVTLTSPFYERKSGQLLSAGTRFNPAPGHRKKDNVSVYVYDNKKNIMRIAYIPKKHIISKLSSPKKQIQQFITLLREWTQSHGTIPYVWGGCSITHMHSHNKFHTAKDSYQNKPITKVMRPFKERIKGGLDCSGLIARAAQIVGIPYFFKNSFTITNQLDELKKGQHIEPGDIVWIAGHVLVIASDTTIIEARHYDHGYGKIHEISLSEQFKAIKSTSDLEKVFFGHTPLYRLDSKGALAQTYKQFKVLKLATAWK